MTWAHPFRALTPRARLATSLGLFGVGMAIHRKQRVDARTDEAPHGTLSLALRDNVSAGRRIRDSWQPATRDAVRRNFMLDIAFSIVWTQAIAMATAWGCDQFERTSNRPAAIVGNLLAWLQWPAALMAIGKDLSSLFLMHGHDRQEYSQFSRWLTLGEIAAKSLGVLYGLASIAHIIWRKSRRHQIA
jgi:hypothetical protein